MQETEFEINRDAVKNYFLAFWVSACVGVLVLFLGPFGFFFLVTAVVSVGAGSVFFFVPMFLLLLMLALPMCAIAAFSFWLCPQQVKALRYWLEDNTLRADGGVLFKFQKSIPLERITDVALVQGPLLRYFNIWAMQIQTAGSAQCEATLYGVRNPEEIRELILSQRQRIYGEKTGDA